MTFVLKRPAAGTSGDRRSTAAGVVATDSAEVSAAARDGSTLVVDGA
jgi:hypothetical protein